jgi:hypothetical protein
MTDATRAVSVFTSERTMPSGTSPAKVMGKFGPVIVLRNREMPFDSIDPRLRVVLMFAEPVGLYDMARPRTRAAPVKWLNDGSTPCPARCT